MNLEERVSRRLQDDDGTGPVIDQRALSPADHLEEPVDRGPVLERLLDRLEPALDGDTPENTYVWGPAGGGKSAAATALFEHLSREVSPPPSSIFTSTRGASGGRSSFVYVDARTANSEFQLYRQVLARIVGESIPEGGVSTADLRERLAEAFEHPGNAAVVAVDHVGEPATPTVGAVADAFDPLGRIAWLCIGREPPEAVPDAHDRTVEVPAYERLTLEDVLSTRASNGLSANALSHEQVRRVAEWADGNAHDGLAALFGGAELARARDAEAVDDDDATAGMAAVPRGGAPVGRLLALPANRQAVLRTLTDVDEAALSSVDSAAEAVARRPSVGLSEGTVKRLLYEFAEAGVLRRVEQDRDGDSLGRPPSRIELSFPTIVFGRLYDAEVGE